MKIVKRILIGIAIVGITVFLFRGFIYNYFISYKTIGSRKTFAASSPKLMEHINAKAGMFDDPEINDIIEMSLDITSSRLNFTVDKNDVDPNNLVSFRTAHCVGYANFFTTTCNYLLQKNDLADTWEVKTEIGQLYLFGVNVHSYLNSPFLKDHDFVSIENQETGEVLAVDPSVHDYLGISLISYQK